jgi:ATP synthase protein I
VDNQSDDRSPMALAMEWVTRITTIALEMAVPTAIGYWIDQHLGTKILFLILAALFGFTAGMWHLLKLAKNNK